MHDNHRLAIVIPAYRPDFFRATLDSITKQTDRRFRVYVGDDAGPPAIAEICDSFPEADLVYHRFEENLGGSSLAGHWNRCVGLSREPWVWLFSDDDVMEPGCVAAFHAAIDAGGETADVLRFDTRVIDRHGATLEENPPHPGHESSVDFVHARLRGERRSYVVEYVFRRGVFEREGGFPDYPVAWCADDAAWFSFARRTGIAAIGGGRVCWRASGGNITDDNTAHQREKLLAAERFLDFVKDEVAGDDDVRTAEAWDDAMELWLVGQVRYLMPIPPSRWHSVLRASSGVWRLDRGWKVAWMAAWWGWSVWRSMLGRLRHLLRS